jgi:entericidin B
MRKLLLMFLCALAFSACNTLEGAGKDIQKAGEAVEKAAK